MLALWIEALAEFSGQIPEIYYSLECLDKAGSTGTPPGASTPAFKASVAMSTSDHLRSSVNAVLLALLACNPTPHPRQLRNSHEHTIPGNQHPIPQQRPLHNRKNNEPDCSSTSSPVRPTVRAPSSCGHGDPKELPHDFAKHGGFYPEEAIGEERKIEVLSAELVAGEAEEDEGVGGSVELVVEGDGCEGGVGLGEAEEGGVGERHLVVVVVVVVCVVVMLVAVCFCACTSA